MVRLLSVIHTASLDRGMLMTLVASFVVRGRRSTRSVDVTPKTAEQNLTALNGIRQSEAAITSNTRLCSGEAN